MVIGCGEIWWAELPPPTDSGPGFRRPVLVVQWDHLNRSAICTVVCAPLTSNLKRGSVPGNVALLAEDSGLPKDSVANASQLISLDRNLLRTRAGRISASMLELVHAGIDIVLGR